MQQVHSIIIAKEICILQRRGHILGVPLSIVRVIGIPTLVPK
jgi:hypothetical protein